jgi:hypothetical protein
MTWLAHGRIFDPVLHAPWLHSHAQVPTAWVMHDKVRVFYAGRNASGTSFITYADFDKADPVRLLYAHDSPIMALGKTGTFDDEGMMPSNIVAAGGRLHFYYSGWNRRLTCPYHNATGLIVSDDDGDSFRREFEGPVLDRIPTEPYLAVTPTVLVENGVWKMWYVSGVSWQQILGHYEPIYVIKHAYSSNGIDWERPGGVCIRPTHSMEAFSRPCVLRERDVYKMWYCYRDSHDYRGGAGSYRMGYAESSDGLAWQRMDDADETRIARNEWDSQMQCYPYVVQIGGRRYMFYNGNGFGRSGFGLAEWME